MSRVETLAGALLACALTAACSGGVPAVERAHEHVASPTCSLRTPDAWQRFLEDAATQPSWTKTCSDLDNCEQVVGDFSQEVQQLLDVLAKCEADVNDNPPIARCTEKLRAFAPAWLRQHSSHTYGFDQPNSEYVARQVALEQPSGMMDSPFELLAALPERSRLEAAAREHGWPYLVHDSGLGGVRLFVLVPAPDGRFEQWLVFGLDEKLERVGDEAIVSFIAAQRTDRQGAPLLRVQPHFRDYLAHAPSGSWELELPTTFGGKCYACHVSGLRQLLPPPGLVVWSQPVRGEADFGESVDPTSSGLARLLSFNQKIASYGLADWGDALETSDHGPALGRALGCTDCHDGRTRGALSVFTSEGMLWQKVVGQLAMRHHDARSPVPDARAMTLLERQTEDPTALSSDETEELEDLRAAHITDFEALMTSRSPDLAAWLLQMPCN